MNKIVVYVLFVLTGATALSLYVVNRDSFASLAYERGIKISEIETFDLIQPDGSYLLGKNEDSGILIEISTIESPEQAVKSRQEQRMLFEAFFKPQTLPYPEFLTNEISCTEKFQPKYYEHELGGYYLTFMGERGNYGVCNKDLISRKAFMGVFFCKSTGNFYKIDYYTGKEESWDVLHKIAQSVSCLE